jgi:hypothetical protein
MDSAVVKAYLSSPPADFDGTYDLIDELISQVKKAKSRPAKKAAAKAAPAKKTGSGLKGLNGPPAGVRNARKGKQ